MHVCKELVELPRDLGVSFRTNRDGQHASDVRAPPYRKTAIAVPEALLADVDRAAEPCLASARFGRAFA
jgi:hypothetical protein